MFLFCVLFDQAFGSYTAINADVLDKIRWKQLICNKSSVSGLFGSCLLENKCLVLAQPGIPGEVM